MRAWLVLLLTLAAADIYLHQPPGSNNRLDEKGRNRNNANRMFDSQNNNRGGYNVGKMSYYVGEEVALHWTNQHGSGKYQLEGTEFIFQMACGDLIRDGTTTSRIPDKPLDCRNFNCDTDIKYGRHESYESYQLCKATERNKGLFTANQNLRRGTARYTRQNPNGARRGYECPEERDYYPYWRPTMWRDLLVITNDPARCKAVQEESQNVKSRWKCELPAAMWKKYRRTNNPIIPITKAACEDVKYGNETAKWVEVAAHNFAPPTCKEAQVTRANHLGLIGGRTQYSTTWTVPNWVHDQCVMRIRYNITTADYPAWKTPSGLEAGINSTMSSTKRKPTANRDPAMYPLWENYQMNYTDVAYSFTKSRNDATRARESREYVLMNNPRVDLFGNKIQHNTLKESGKPKIFRFRLQLATNTAQFGRTFQDRSHTFSIKPRPANIPTGAALKLLSVSGKRGNIVQTFPAHEYFFIPERLTLKKNEFVHFHWTGSNTNPNNNAGQGKRGTDRSNIVPMRVSQYSKTLYSNFKWDGESLEGGNGDIGGSYPGWVASPKGYSVPTRELPVMTGALGGMSDNVLKMLATTRRSTVLDMGNMDELDDAATTFDLPPQKVTAVGCWNYVCTRNNNFSNRSQKGKLCVAEGATNSQVVGQTGATISNRDGDWVTVKAGSLAVMERVSVESWPRSGDSSMMLVSPVDMKLKDGAQVTLSMHYQSRALKHPVMYHSNTGQGGWTKVDDVEYGEDDDGKHTATVDHTSGGYFKIDNELDTLSVALIAIACVIFVLAMAALIYCKCCQVKGAGHTSVQNVGEGQSV